jgi:hypothetical protein
LEEIVKVWRFPGTRSVDFLNFGTRGGLNSAISGEFAGGIGSCIGNCAQ